MRALTVLALILVLSATHAYSQLCLNETFSDPAEFPLTWNVLGGVVETPYGWAHGHAAGEDDPILVLKDPAALYWQEITMDVDASWACNEEYCYCRFFFYLQSTTDWQPNLYPPNGYMFDMKGFQDNVVLSKFVDGEGTTLSTVYRVVTPGIHYHVRIVAISGHISVFIEDELVIDVYDNSFTEGTIGFSASTGGAEWSSVDSYYDNVAVQCGSDPTPVQNQSWGSIKAIFR